MLIKNKKKYCFLNVMFVMLVTEYIENLDDRKLNKTTGNFKNKIRK